VANFLGRLQTFLFGAAIGRAASDSVTPVLEPVRQHAWEKNQVKVVDPATAADAVAKRFITQGEGQGEASKAGIDSSRFGLLTRLAQRFPGISEAKPMANRKLITPAQVREVLARHGVPDDYTDAFLALFAEILTPGELAAAIHRGLVPSADLLLGEQPEPPFKVEAYPVQPIDPLAEAAGSGFDRERLQVLVGLQGLPMGPHEAAQAFFRGIITHGDYIRAFNTSNMRNEWAQAILDQTRQIPTARDFFENALRGHHTFDWAAQQAARHGMDADDALVIYQNQGRPLNLHQISQGIAWGAKYNPAAGDNPDPWMQAILLGPVRPEFYELNDALRYNLPTAFNFRALQEANVIGEDEAAMWYRRLGWPPELAAKVAKAYAKGTGGSTGNPYVAKAQTQLWTAIHRNFMNGELSRDAADSKLATLIPDVAARNEVLDLWTIEDEATTKPLTPAAIKKSYSENAFTLDEAAARLVAQQWSAADAQLYLQS
jgi:hypothetical protein